MQLVPYSHQSPRIPGVLVCAEKVKAESTQHADLGPFVSGEPEVLIELRTCGPEVSQMGAKTFPSVF